MRTFTYNWRNVFVTLLLGLLASLTSISASAYTVIANASASTNLSGIAPWTANLDGSASTCNSSPQDYPCQWHWNFGDGTSSDPASDAAGNSSVSHIYATAGTYTVTLTVTLVVPTGTKPQSSTTLVVAVQQGETLASYVSTCKQQLGFTDADVAAIASSLNCNKGILFATDTNVVNDYFGYARVNDSVDLAFACRWANNPGTGITTPPFARAVSLELLMNNHQNGNTCFFRASDTTIVNGNPVSKDVSTAIISPTVAAAAAPNTAAANFWNVPIELDRNLPCVDCHVAGPYISTPRIAPFLAQFGLLNNGHDTFGLTLNGQNPVGNYHIVGSTFAHFNNLAASENVAAANTCTLGCHAIGYNSTQGNINGFLNGSIDTLLPGITSVFDINDSGTPDISVIAAGVMRPWNASDYQWVNLDTPTNNTPSAGIEQERFADAVAASNVKVISELFSTDNPNCPSTLPSGTTNFVPNLMEAHIVGSNNEVVVNQANRFAFLPDRLSVFNLKDGLTCLNGDQDAGQPSCQNYSLQYECTNNTTGAKSWVNWPQHGLSSDGDHEERNGANPCASGSTATGIQALFTWAVNGWTYGAYGPNDRLAQMSPYGVICNASDQPDGKCSNYVVRYSGCVAPPPTQSNKTLTSENATAGSKQLTAASGSLTKGQAHNGSWNTQVWTIEPVVNTEYVRLHNVPTNVYLTVTSTAEQATVGTAASNTTNNEMWLIEQVANSSYVRFKNLFSGKYLTMGDPNNFKSTPDYIPIYSQGRNTGWNTQRWLIQ